MVELIEDDSWVHFDEPFPLDLAERIQASAIQNGRTFSEEFSYRVMLSLGMLRPGRTH